MYRQIKRHGQTRRRSDYMDRQKDYTWTDKGTRTGRQTWTERRSDYTDVYRQINRH